MDWQFNYSGTIITLELCSAGGIAYEAGNGSTASSPPPFRQNISYGRYNLPYYLRRRRHHHHYRLKLPRSTWHQEDHEVNANKVIQFSLLDLACFKINP